MLIPTPVIQDIGEISLALFAKYFEEGGRYPKGGSWRGGDKYGSRSP
ncbi:MAG: hypothetical protein G3M70_13460 [Candidatus Nitronauta litoralis]|uniref:Uncharacterized protein n=1 Tax=Candidatus Nitronauta litoralis TaxID=2705533 RepID=A0A7T0BXP2_9BACT|nr:MAG: hypothetical protein G3M70_13460 [Candidatus Nitronauta litoralis]